MHIAFKFHYTHDNGLFVRLLKRIRERSSLPVTLIQEKHTYIIEATGEQKELGISGGAGLNTDTAIAVFARLHD